ncbi:hypothetical protein [Longispora urticae]
MFKRRVGVLLAGVVALSALVIGVTGVTPGEPRADGDVMCALTVSECPAQPTPEEPTMGICGPGAITIDCGWFEEEH